MKKIILAFMLAVSTVSYAQSKEDLVTSFAGMKIRLPVPTGYCFLDRNDPAAIPLYAFQDEANVGRSKVVALFIDCNEMEQLRSDPDYRQRRSGGYYFAYLNGEEFKLPFGMFPKTFLKSLIKEVPKYTDDAMNLDETVSEINKKFSELTKSSTQIETPTVLGLIDSNDNAMYVGMMVKAHYPNETVTIAAVLGTAMVKRVILRANFYAEYDPKSSFGELLNEEKKAIEAIIAANR